MVREGAPRAITVREGAPPTAVVGCERRSRGSSTFSHHETAGDALARLSQVGSAARPVV